MAHGYQLPKVCVQVLNETIERLLPKHRDSVGVINDGALIVDLIQTVQRENPEVVRLIQQTSFPHLAANQTAWFLRTSKSSYVIHHNEHKGIERKQAIKSKQRTFVTYIDAAGLTIRKERHMLTKAELLKVVNYYEARQQADQDVIDWCLAAYQQMNLLGLGDDAVVSEVLEEDAA